MLEIIYYSCPNELGVVFDICWFYLQNTVVFILFPSESSKIREEMVNTKYSATIMEKI